MTRHHHNPARARGTTLLELILYIGIIGVLLTTVVGFSLQFLTTRLKADAAAEAAWNARFAVGRIAAEIRQAGGFVPATTGGSVFGSNPSTLILCPATTASGSVSCTAATGTVFAVNPVTQQLTAAVNGGAALPLTSPKVAVADFTVTNLSTNPGHVRSRNFAITVRTVFKETGLWPVAPEAAYQTTERIRRAEGFSN